MYYSQRIHYSERMNAVCMATYHKEFRIRRIQNFSKTLRVKISLKESCTLFST